MTLKIITTICLIGIGTLMLPTTALSRELTKDEKEKIENAVKLQLKDPDSARFTFPHLLEGNLTDLPGRYCGKVNAKNSYGGYSGDSWFATNINTLKDGKIKVEMQEGNFLDIAEICIKGGYQ